MNLAVDRLAPDPRAPRIAAARAIDASARGETTRVPVDARAQAGEDARNASRSVVIAPSAWRRAPPPQIAAFAAQLYAQAPERRAAHLEDREGARRAYEAALGVAPDRARAPGASVSLLV